jgi:hypothetical protein
MSAPKIVRYALAALLAWSVPFAAAPAAALPVARPPSGLDSRPGRRRLAPAQFRNDDGNAPQLPGSPAPDAALDGKFWSDMLDIVDTRMAALRDAVARRGGVGGSEGPNVAVMDSALQVLELLDQLYSTLSLYYPDTKGKKTPARYKSLEDRLVCAAADAIEGALGLQLDSVRHGMCALHVCFAAVHRLPVELVRSVM